MYNYKIKINFVSPGMLKTRVNKQLYTNKIFKQGYYCPQVAQVNLLSSRRTMKKTSNLFNFMLKIMNYIFGNMILKIFQVSILVRPATGGNAVLLNVPKAVAMKVKVGTTLSFSASSDLKYTVMDSKMHPPVGKKPPGANQTQAVKQQPHQRQLPNLPPGNYA